MTKIKLKKKSTTKQISILQKIRNVKNGNIKNVDKLLPILHKARTNKVISSAKFDKIKDDIKFAEDDDEVSTIKKSFIASLTKKARRR